MLSVMCCHKSHSSVITKQGDKFCHNQFSYITYLFSRFVYRHIIAHIFFRVKVF